MPVTVTGDKALLAKMAATPTRTIARLEPLGQAALQPMKASAKANAATHRQPHNPAGGHLDQGIVIQKIPGQPTLTRQFWLSLTGRARKIGHLVEFGTAPHYQPRRKRMHPGAKAKPFMTPAYEQNKAEAIGIVSNGLWASIVAAAGAIGGKS